MSKYRSKMKYQKSKIHIRYQIESAAFSARGVFARSERSEDEAIPSGFNTNGIAALFSVARDDIHENKVLMTKTIIVAIIALAAQFCFGQAGHSIVDAIEQVAQGKSAETLTLEDHRGTRHTIFAKDGDIFYCIPKSDTINLSCTDARSSNPLPMLVDDTLSLFWKEEIGHRVVVYYRRHLILAPIGLWTRPTCLYTKMNGAAP